MRKKIVELKGRKRKIEVVVQAVERAGLLDGEVVWHKRICLVSNDPKAPSIASQISELVFASGCSDVDDVLKLVAQMQRKKKGAKKR